MDTQVVDEKSQAGGMPTWRFLLVWVLAIVVGGLVFYYSPIAVTIGMFLVMGYASSTSSILGMAKFTLISTLLGLATGLLAGMVAGFGQRYALRQFSPGLSAVWMRSTVMGWMLAGAISFALFTLLSYAILRNDPLRQSVNSVYWLVLLVIGVITTFAIGLAQMGSMRRMDLDTRLWVPVTVVSWVLGGAVGWSATGKFAMSLLFTIGDFSLATVFLLLTGGIAGLLTGIYMLWLLARAYLPQVATVAAPGDSTDSSTKDSSRPNEP
jgi:magnesium-transporting ATPase (P-type)